MKGTVYMIWSEQTPKRYYGSTIQTLSMRMSGHRSHMKRWRAGKDESCSSFDVLCFDDARIEWVETVEFTNRVELAAREGWWMRNNECVNKQIAGRTPVECSIAYRATHTEEKTHIAQLTSKKSQHNKQHTTKKTKHKRPPVRLSKWTVHVVESIHMEPFPNIS